MNHTSRFVVFALAASTVIAALPSRGPMAQSAVESVAPQRPGPGRGARGPGGPAGPPADLDVVKQFDRDGDGRLNAEERKAARAFLEGSRPGRGRGMGRGMADLAATTPAKGPSVTPDNVATFAGRPLYDPTVLRTLFLEFDNPDWEDELSAFARTDVEVPATLVVDGQRFRDVGVRFRGASSLMSVPEGRKRSLNLSLDFADKAQSLGGYRTLNLLNSHGDPTFLRTMLYLQAAREYLPAPQANYVRVVINGESWGVYVNAQQFNKDFLRDFYKTTDGARWKVPGSPNGRGGLEYLGNDAAPYKRIYEIKSKDDAASWTALIELTRVLNQTPADQLEAALAPILDVDAALRFLALENTLVNADGYWTRASDYYLYRDVAGRFHVVPHDANETFGPGGGMRQGGPPAGGRGGPGMGGRGGRGGGPELDPLVGLDDPSKPLRSKLLAVPALRDRYLTYVRDVASRWLDWTRLAPLVRQYQSLIAADVASDTRKLSSTDEFSAAVERLKSFVELRREYLK